MKSYKTPKGTELPLLNLRGKDYLEVKYRLVWFREDHANWSIETSFVSLTDRSACAKAIIKDDQGRVIATSHKFENQMGFMDFMEKAETGAIGRALALIGYGTQFCADELDEGDRIVDAPVAGPAHYEQQRQAVQAQKNVDESFALEGDEDQAVPPLADSSDLGEFRIPFGRKYRGKKLKEIPRKEIEGYLAWLEADAVKKGSPLSYEARILKTAVENYHHQQDDQTVTEAS